MYRGSIGTTSCGESDFVAETGVNGTTCHIGASISIPGLVPPLQDSRSYESGQSAGGRFDGEWTVTAGKVDKAPVDAPGPDGEEWYPGSTRSLDSLGHMRLMALLRDMIDAEDRAKAASRLGVSYRTVSRAIDSGRLTARMSAALERHLLLGGGSAAAQQREMVETLAERVASLEDEFRTALEAIEGRCKTSGEEQAKAIRQLERRMTRLESAKDVESAPSVAASDEKPAPAPPWREYRELVTEEAEPGEEGVYGEATPLIVEWRGATAERKRAAATGTALERAEARIRALELEIELIDIHELTLPPDTYPWDWSGRREHLRRRMRSLENARVDRRWALLRRWLRRVLTFGLWRK